MKIKKRKVITFLKNRLAPKKEKKLYHVSDKMAFVKETSCDNHYIIHNLKGILSQLAIKINY